MKGSGDNTGLAFDSTSPFSQFVIQVLVCVAGPHLGWIFSIIVCRRLPCASHSSLFLFWHPTPQHIFTSLPCVTDLHTSGCLLINPLFMNKWRVLLQQQLHISVLILSHLLCVGCDSWYQTKLRYIDVRWQNCCSRFGDNGLILLHHFYPHWCISTFITLL